MRGSDCRSLIWPTRRMALINAAGTFGQLTAVHVGSQAVYSAGLTMQGTNLDSRIEVAAAKLADVDRRIASIDGIVRLRVAGRTPPPPLWPTSA
jgi:hypothetical protein